MGAFGRLTGMNRAHVGGKIAALVMAAAGVAVFSVLALSFFAVAIYNALVPGWGPSWAASIVGIVALLIAVLLGLVVMVMADRTKQSVARAVRTSAIMTFAPVAMSFVSRRAGTLGALAAIATGFLVGRNRF
jgi:phosphoglycerol transferase MdoB-like AlkP superfamily enzyme